ncbi:hypothetical protein SYJ56_11195 [Algoriphagus sp. D3-2-R+10]|uniref:hypothetical protein n=1 Tax=Algoriphagus aurantiacus TaxID=3103948 RepID=UPI002B387BA3|nr:hypothetical protein [Algoriphagus sp. D3-2-R+10]MEB2775875.1 hypothetical protein [Algoriphagus sp. D3-2-R+10]
MKNHILLIMISVCSLVNYTDVYSQTTNTDNLFYKNSIQLTSGTLIFNYSAVTFSYERILKEARDNSKSTLYLKFGIGKYEIFDWAYISSANYTYFQFGFFTGINGSHFELNVGPNIGFNAEETKVHIFSGSMGYRLQKPGKHFILRTGVGYPEALYFGLGWGFGKK